MMNDGPQSPETPTLVEQLFQQEEAETGSISKIHPNTMTSTTDSGLRDELDNERDMLVQQAKGALGFVERIPLPIKLIMLTLISTLGVIVLTGVLIAIVAQQLHETSVTNRYIKNLVPADIFAKCIRTERSPSLIYMAEGRPPVHLQSVLSARSCIDNAIQPLRATYSEYLSVAKDSVAQTRINTVEESYKTLPIIRGVVLGTTNNGVDVADVMNWYADFIEQVLFLIDDYYRNLGDTSNSGPVYSTLFHLAGSVARLRGSGDILFNSEFSVKSYANLYAAVERFKQSEVEFIAIADSTLLNKYHTQTVNTVFRNNTWAWAQMAINQTYQNASFLEYWDGNATAWINALIALEVDTLAQFTASASKNNSMSIFYICIVVLLPIIVLICSLVFGIIFAKTITGPWQRLNRLQQETISKFVPISFLHAIKCNSIAEAELGKFVQNETVILFCEIGDFYITTKNLKPQELINFLNSFFKAMCPSTRNHGGFIDKYTPDGFIALFRRRKDAFAAGVEMQNALVRFNEQLPKGVSPISMCVAIHAANTIVGVVGESDSSAGRMSGVSLSNGIHVTRKLAAMGLRLECKMIVSEGLIPNVKKTMAYRQVGRIYDTDSDDIPFVDAYDVFSSAEFIKISSKHIYSQAMTQLMEKNYSDASTTFSSIDTCSDKASTVYANTCKKATQLARIIAHTWSIKDTLSFPTTFQAFEKYCNTEHSSENITLWKMIDIFTKFDDQVVIKQQAKVMVELCSSVNLNNEFKEKVTQAVNANKVDDTVFAELQLELEIIMSDAHKRFKDHSSFINALCETILECNL